MGNPGRVALMIRRNLMQHRLLMAGRNVICVMSVAAKLGELGNEGGILPGKVHAELVWVRI